MLNLDKTISPSSKTADFKSRASSLIKIWIKATTMTTKVAIIGLGIMGQRMLTHMRLHHDFEPDYLWDPNKSACHQAIILDPQSKVMDSASDAISKADLVYLACPPAVREPYALAAAAAGKALFLEKPFGINLDDSARLMAGLQAYNVPIAVNFTQASGAALTDLLVAKERGEMGALLGVDVIVTYPAWPRQWQKGADWLRFRTEGGMTREVISHFLFFTERVLGPLSLISAHTTYPDDPSLCETAVLARLESETGQAVSILATIGGAQPDRQEFTVKGTKSSRRITEFHKDAITDGGNFVALREPPKDPRAISLKAQLDDLLLHLAAKPNRLATMEEAFRIQTLVESILSKSL
jgi:predicted dehydrogenase